MKHTTRKQIISMGKLSPRMHEFLRLAGPGRYHAHKTWRRTISALERRGIVVVDKAYTQWLIRFIEQATLEVLK